MKKRYRIKSKFRFCLSLTIMLIILISVTGNVIGTNQAVSMTKPVYTEIMIVNGDTLWDLAKAYGPEDQDVRKIVHAICQINDISADKIQSGQKILIPRYL
ncbi:MAG: LysM peptidoglycan-binding domain-containing protein [Clostridiales bacterium]|nr:LysM peptidoglycan-binding domain-containing protein [Clostridiales bacterium]